MRFMVLLATYLLSSPLITSAASFDCGKASTWIEKKICSDLELSDADELLDQAYKKRLEMADDTKSLIKEQRKWLKKRNAITDEFMLLRLYKDRMIELGEPVMLPLKFINSACSGFRDRNDIGDISDCKVSDTGIIGIVGGRTYHYSLYCIIPDYVSSSDGKCDSKLRAASYYGKRGLSIFYREGASNNLRLFMDRGSSDIGLYIYDKPQIVKHTFGTLLYVPVRLDGTGHYNESEYYLWDKIRQDWKMIDSTSWHSEARKKLPAEADFSHGIWPNIATMTAVIYLFGKDDPPCCPSGGEAEISLTLKDGRFSVKSIKIVKEQ